jgi:polysaccharide export outer membrane protein
MRISDMRITETIQNEFIQSVVAILIFLLLLLTSCGGKETRPDLVLQQQAVPAVSNTSPEKLNAEITQKSVELRKNVSPADYRVGPEDLLEINVFQANELNTVARVSSSGYIKLPLIDKIKASGLSVYELEALVTEKLKTYLSEPVVGIFVKEYRSQQITVLGAVAHPGVLYVSGQRTLLDVVSLAGGLSQDAGDICIVERNVINDSNPKDGAENTEKNERIVIDLDQLLIKGRVELNIPMSSGDVVLIPKSGIFFVDGAVKSPGVFPLKGKTTVTQAISMAKGLGYEAIKSDIKIYRDIGKQERDVILIDYNDILDRKTVDIELKDKDIIIVASSAFKRLIGGLAGYFNFGMFGFSGVKPGSGF